MINHACSSRWAMTFSSALLLTSSVLSGISGDAASRACAWPPLTSATKPWAYWHWMGSAVDEANLVGELRRYADAGLGGMHIVPIYGAKGWEDRALPYLEPRWMQRLAVAVTEARRLGLDIDMTTGTGWNFGGPHISEALSCLRLANQLVPVAAGQSPPPIAQRASLLALLAEQERGVVLDLTDRVAADGRVDWQADGPGWRLRVVRLQAGRPEVERAAPGGEGPMLNPFYRSAMDHYLKRFTEAFGAYPGPRPRAMYHDSYEYHGAAWAPDLFAEFARRRGYGLEAHRAELFGGVTNELVRRVRCDYRETLSDLLLEAMTQPWTDWARRHGFLTRNQAHGSPGNLLDLYAAADMPETEMFHNDRDILVSKFASSAAHVAGRARVAAETGTWVAEHFTETLADLKRNVDDLLLAGVNHLFYHGTCYSPDEAGWPGWLFYAATQLNPRNSIWRDVPALNAYVARSQAVLQAGRPDNDLLLYWPIHDLWHDQGPLVEELTVHRRQWFDGQAVGQLARALWQQGYAFDYVSDRQLATARVSEGELVLAGGSYRVLLVPACRHLPLDTLRKLLDLARLGATVIFADRLPDDVPGLAWLEERRRGFKALRENLQFAPVENVSVRQARVGEGRVWVGEARATLARAGLRREAMTDAGALAFVRRRSEQGADYFIVNRGARPFAGWVPLAFPAQAAALLDPLTGRAGIGAVRPATNGGARVYLQLDSHHSIIVRALSRPTAGQPTWNYVKPAAPATELTGAWQVRFLEGGPELPAPGATDRLVSWTELGGEAAKRFAGTARYTLTFDGPTAAQGFQIDLGRIAQSARVRLNGRDYGTVFMPPYRVLLDDVKPGGNVLDIEVTSTAANRIRDLDRRGVKWKTFHDINFVSINYRPFDASHWPLHEAGLLGPVTLQAVESLPEPQPALLH